MRFPWGGVLVRKDEFWPLQAFHYDCRGSCSGAEDPEAAENLACAAAMLAEFLDSSSIRFKVASADCI